MEFMLLEMLSKYPQATMIFVVVGVFRAIFKPIMAVLEAFVVATPTISDDNFLAKLKENAIYKKLAWVVDYLMSIKLPGQM